MSGDGSKKKICFFRRFFVLPYMFYHNSNCIRNRLNGMIR